MTNKECVMCGSKEVVYEVGSGQKAILNGTDYSEIIAGFYICRDCKLSKSNTHQRGKA